MFFLLNAPWLVRCRLTIVLDGVVVVGARSSLCRSALRDDMVLLLPRDVREVPAVRSGLDPSEGVGERVFFLCGHASSPCGGGGHERVV